MSPSSPPDHVGPQDSSQSDVLERISLEESVGSEELARSAVRLKFPEAVERLFLEDYWRNTIRDTQISLLFGFVLYASFGILDLWAVPKNTAKIWAIRYGIVCPALLSLTILTLFPSKRRFVQPAIVAAGIAAGLGIAGMIFLMDPEEVGYRFYFVGLILCMMFLFAPIRLRFWSAVLTNGIIVAGFEYVSYHQGKELPSAEAVPFLITEHFLLVSALSIGGFTCYALELYTRRDFLQRLELLQERMKSEQLLLNILPASIADRLKNETGTIADAFDSISVLFADIENFTPLSDAIPANQLVEMLNRLFSHFDRLTEKYQVEKIKTIGDCYMVASGVPVPRPDHAHVLVALAFEMRDYIAQHATVNGRKLGIRIGISSGPAVAGVIGQKKYIYDLWGDTVNTASRMESHGRAGTIQISEATHALIQKDFECQSQGRVPIKGKSKMEVWHVLKPKAGPSPGL